MPQIHFSDSYEASTPAYPAPYAFAGLTTFGNLPYVYCLADTRNEAVEKFDIAILGAPFDTVNPIACHPFHLWLPMLSTSQHSSSVTLAET